MFSKRGHLFCLRAQDIFTRANGIVVMRFVRLTRRFSPQDTDCCCHGPPRLEQLASLFLTILGDFYF